jgi:hypothetical protein
MSYKNPGQKKMNQAGISTFWNFAYEISSNPNAAKYLAHHPDRSRASPNPVIQPQELNRLPAVC